MDNIQSYGINVVRVPFSWRNLQDADGNWYKDTSGNIDFSRFDWVVQEAAKRHIYVIFDYHIWPGEQKNYGDICEAGEPGLAQRAQSAAIWGALAQHFKGNGTVAAFDLINEPTGSNDFYAAHRAFYAAIRAQDPERMLVAEWVNTADFPKLGWTNIMCSGHYPASTKAKFDSFLAELPKHTDYSTTVPCYVGEWICDVGSNADQNAVDMTEALDRLGWCWTTWTYKTVNMGGWGLFDYTNSLRYNLATDPSDSILKQWQTELTQWQNPALPKNYYLNTSVIKALQQIGGGTE
jgi:aryl-phospho-beta-D-glucosidase BglC (GH1 family)